MKELENKSFEEALARLEEIVRLLENGKGGLDDSLSAFEEGIALVKYCNEKLATAEQKVRVLMQDEGGAWQETDFASREA
jgi:exodeoxyribonuclease VII small subunit